MKARIIEIHPDADRPGWSLFVLDDTGDPVDYSGADTFAATVRAAGTILTIAGDFTASSLATVDNDDPADVPTLLFEPAVAACSLLTTGGPARIVVYVGSGDTTTRHDFPAKVVP